MDSNRSESPPPPYPTDKFEEQSPPYQNKIQVMTKNDSDGFCETCLSCLECCTAILDICYCCCILIKCIRQ